MAPKKPQKPKAPPQVRNAEAAPAAEERLEDGTYAPGTSGNPGGMSAEMRALREALVRKCAPKAVDVAVLVLDRCLNTKDLQRVVANGEPEAALVAERAMLERADQAIRVTAEVLKYSAPKPKQEVSVEGSLATPFAGLTPEQLVAIATGKSLGP